MFRRLAYRILGERCLAWGDLRAHRVVEPLRRDGRVLTATDAALATLQLYGLLSFPLIAVEPSRKFGLRKTHDYAQLCESLDFYEIEPGFAREARRFLPSMAKIRWEDTTVAEREGGGVAPPLQFRDNRQWARNLRLRLVRAFLPLLRILRLPCTACRDRGELAARALGDRGRPGKCGEAARHFSTRTRRQTPSHLSFERVVEAYHRLLPPGRVLQDAFARPHPVGPVAPYRRSVFHRARHPCVRGERRLNMWTCERA
jgi:hypothetical protein